MTRTLFDVAPPLPAAVQGKARRAPGEGRGDRREGKDRPYRLSYAPGERCFLREDGTILPDRRDPRNRNDRRFDHELRFAFDEALDQTCGADPNLRRYAADAVRVAVVRGLSLERRQRLA